MRFSEFLNEATQKSKPYSVVEQTIKRWFLKNVFTQEYKELDVDHHFMTFEEWQEFKFERDIKFEGSANRCKIGGTNNWLGHYLDHDVIPAIPEHAMGDEWREAVEKFFNKMLKPLGWFVFRIGKGTIYFDPLKQKQVEGLTKLYHFSPLHNKERILKKGIIPKGSNGRYSDDYKYPPRVHLLTRYNAGEIYHLAMNIFNFDASPEDHYHGSLYIPPLVIFEVDVSKCRPGTKFYEDVSVKNGVWTYTHIPPAALSVKSEDKDPDEEGQDK